MLSKRIIQAFLNGVPVTRDDDGLDFVEYVKKDLKYRLNANKIKQSRYENGLCGMNLFQEFLRTQGKGTYRDDSIYLGEVSRLLGHASTKTTEKVYADYITSTLREKMTDLGFDFLPELGG